MSLVFLLELTCCVASLLSSHFEPLSLLACIFPWFSFPVGKLTSTSIYSFEFVLPFQVISHYQYFNVVSLLATLSA